MNTGFFPLAGLTLAVLLALPAHARHYNATVNANAAGPVIHRNVYGQFAEHLGSGIYGGLWVGPESGIPNTKGWRNDVVGALKDLQVPLIRWPGGCFADEYHWRDGIGPRSQRPARVNTNWGGVTEDNAVGTHEFFDLAELVGAETYVNANLRSGSPQETSEWIEYMTANDQSALAKLRRKNGRDKPFKVDYFAIGNEAWGCGGYMKPEKYTAMYREHVNLIRAPQPLMPKLIASGGNDTEPRWTEVLSRELKGQTDAISLHYYTLPTGDWKVKGAATGFPESEWQSTIANTLKMDGLIAQNIAELEPHDPAGRISLALDEWGTWYDVEKGTNASFLYQQNTLRDAVVAALNFNIFHKYAERVRMTNIAQMVNVLQAMILTDKERMVLTPTYHTYRMYVPFQDATRLPVQLKAAQADTATSALSVSAARARNGKLYLALVNPDLHDAATLTVDVSGAKVRNARGQILTAMAMDAHNTFSKPNAVLPKPYEAQASDGKLQLTLPAKSVVVVSLQD